MTLNEEQTKAVFTKTQHICLIAAAGSGKTRVIVERVKHLIQNGINPNEILAITFTNKSANEMQERINNQAVVVNTFHGYCYQLLNTDNIKLIEEVNHPFTEEQLTKFSNYKNKLFQGITPLGFNNYQKYLRENHLSDFDDLLLSTINIVAEHSFKYLFIDEFQDTNLLQYYLLKKMIKSTVSSFVVGDPDQSIYGFRGATNNIIYRYISDFQATVLKLILNYRSDQTIINAANNLIVKNPHRYKKSIIPVSNENGIVKVFIGDYDEEKLLKRIRRIKQTINDIAVIYRFHHQGIMIRKMLDYHYLTTIKTMTIHEAKGLEFICVFLIGVEVMPVLISYQRRQVYEERRLMFVAITRAKQQLYIYSKVKTRFINDLKVK